MSTKTAEKSNLSNPGKVSQTRRIRLQGLALGLYLLCPLGAFFSWQAGLTFLSGIFLALVGMAFALTIIRG